jgi:hypothetical protein
MARVALPNVDTAGVYRFLARQEEDGLAAWEANVVKAHRTGVPYPRQRILDDLRAGRIVNVPLRALPPWARTAVPTRRGRLGLAVIQPGRAIVTPDDAITWSGDFAGLFLEENDL